MLKKLKKISNLKKIGGFMFIKKESKQRTTILNAISIIGIIVFSPILLYGIINTIKHFDSYIDILTRRL